MQPIVYAMAGRVWSVGLIAFACNTAFAERWFLDVTDSSGVEFAHDSGKRGEMWTLEITGSGVAVLDFDGDGWLDIWLVQGGPLGADPEGTGGSSTRAPRSDTSLRIHGADVPQARDRLYRNLGSAGQLRFEDITDESGVEATEYGMGIATGDVDNDGDTDVFLANFGRNQLFENIGGGRFRNVSEASGLSDDAWSISASMADIDGDGLLDLYVGNYLDFKFADYQACRRWSTRLTYCAPSNFEPVADRLYRNAGNGRFVDTSKASGISAARGGAMGVAADDFNADGKTDFFVANDGVDNLLWLNRGDGTFEDGGLFSGVAVNGDGVAEASMGIAVADYDRDGDPDIFVTHDIKESNTLYVNNGKGWFEDQTAAARLAAASLPYTGFGTGWVDLDNDGDLDVVNVNGAVAVVESQLAQGIDPPLRQVNQIMLNDGRGRFRPADAGVAFSRHGVSRGAAFGDLDNDGDIDVVVTNNDGPARVYQNVARGGNWLGLDLRAVAGMPNVIGTVVELEGKGEERKRVHTDGSYASAKDPRLVFGLGDDGAPQSVRVHWPNGVVEVFEALLINDYHAIRYGTGHRVEHDSCALGDQLDSEGPDRADGASAVRFVDVSRSAELDFRHVNGMAGEKWLPEIIGAGAAVFDFDGDGHLDVWLVQSGHLAGRAGGGLRDQLFRNVGAEPLRFENVTEHSGVRSTGYGMGIATGDVDNDGDLDVFVANYGRNHLYRNVGGGRFVDITESSGVGHHEEWSTGASFADIDGDGRLDLYVANYLEFSLKGHKVCRDLASRPTYCAPHSYRPESDRLYRNLGNGLFEDIGAGWGIEGRYGGALGVVADDFDGDTDVDFYVANDAVANLLWLNDGGGRFTDNALLAGVAVNGDGDAEASMGVDALDFDNDCDVDLFLTHLVAETNTLYENQGSGWFVDASNRRGIAMDSGPFTGFGTGWLDADNDGDLDLFSANGAITEVAEQRDAGILHPFRQPNQLWLNQGRGTYREANPPGGAFLLNASSRGASFGDLDNDGDIDIVVANNNDAVRLYRNESDIGHWLGLELQAPGSAVIGSTVWLDGPVCHRRRVATDGSFASAHDPRVVFGLGSMDDPRVVRVRWPDGTEERFGGLAVDRYHRLRRGEGSPWGER